MKEFINTLSSLNLYLAAEGEDLVLKGQKGKLTQEEIGIIKSRKDIVSYIKTNKQDLLAYVKANAGDRPTEDRGISAIYSLSPMQEGMLFHAIYDPSSDVYYTQFTCDIAAAVDVSLFKQSWHRILDTYTIFRSAFHCDTLSVPVQSVHKQVALPFTLLDYSALTQEAQLEKLASFLKEDKHTKFCFDYPPLMRVTLIKRTDNLFTMVWTHHHILMDGWSMPIVMGALLSNYEQLLRGVTLPPVMEDSYEAYIRYIQTHDAFSAEGFWKKYLNGLEQPCLLPFVPAATERNKGNGVAESLNLTFDIATTSAIKDFAQAHRLTVNTVVQGVWSILLAAYTGNEHVAFGVTVSGRPASLDGAEQKVGLYINTLLLHTFAEKGAPIVPWLTNIQKENLACQEYQFTPLNKIQVWSGIKGEIFDTSLVFENYPVSEALEQKWSLDITAVEADERNNFMLSLTAVQADHLNINFKYNTAVLHGHFVQLMSDHFRSVMEQIVLQQKETLAQITITTERERQFFVKDVNKTFSQYDTSQNLALALKRRAEQHPDALALVWEGNEMSYAAFLKQVQQLAYQLAKKGITQGCTIGISFERSPEMIIAIWGILMLGAVYVPIDPNNPQERIDFMIRNADIKWVITTMQFDRELMMFTPLINTKEAVHLLMWDELEGSLDEVLEPTPYNTDAPAYIMYTSGTTGTPKGIVVSHSNILKLAYEPGDIAVHQSDRVLQWSNFAFDGSVYDIFASLLNGAALCLISKEQARDAAQLAAVMQNDHITVCFMTTALFNAFVEYDAAALKGLRKVLFGGQMVSLPHVVTAFNHVGPHKLVHVYGPTETTVYATAYPINEPPTATVPIGGPLHNTYLYITDANRNPLGTGIPGEIWIGGAGVAKGYLGNDALTQEKFIDNPFHPHEGKIYRTGDYGRWNAAGTVEFVGRKDDQVKIRGYRIELGEVEKVLQDAPGIKQCCVVATAGEDHTKRLIGYIVTDDTYQYETLQAHLAANIPDYMIPAVMVELELMPLTPNGKIDKKALPQPEAGKSKTDTYVAPHTEEEKQMATIWERLLQRERIGIHDNFFEMGGDSIITIQVASRAKRLGYHLQPHHVFENPTIAALANVMVAEAAKTAGEQGLLDGDVPLIPVQQWFFEHNSNSAALSHFNQVMLLNVDKGSSMALLGNVVDALTTRHDALRLAYKKEGQVWKQYYGKEKPTLRVKDLSGETAQTLTSTIEAACNESQQSLSIEQTGHIAQFVLMLTPAFEPFNRLFIVVHHLAIDGVSWRILLEDLQTLLKNEQTDTVGTLGAKTHSFREWGQALLAHAEKKSTTQQLPFWKEQLAAYRPLHTDKDAPMARWSEVQHHYDSLDEATTAVLLKEASKAYNTEINDLLLAALAQTIGTWSDNQRLLIGLEGHGREPINAAIDITNTVGWFTNLYPVSLLADTKGDIETLILSTKEKLRQILDKGMGFGVLRYLHPDAQIRKQLGDAKWDIVFNYMGQYDNVVGEQAACTPAGEPTGEDAAGDMPFPYKLSVSGSVTGGRFMIAWAYSGNHYHAATVQSLCNEYIKNLKAICTHCSSSNAKLFTASDFQLDDAIAFRELNQFLQENNITESGKHILYRLSPLQEGMFFHGMYDDAATAYTNQFQGFIRSKLNVAAFKNTWEYIVAEHSILRTSFHHAPFGMPVQCVHKQVQLPFAVFDYSGLSDDEQLQTYNQFITADRADGFNFGKAPLMRITLLKWQEDSYTMVWTYHHLLMDGWSMPTLLGKMIRLYEQFATNHLPGLPVEDRFSDYIRFINRKDVFSEKQFWQQYLQTLESPSLLPFISSYDRNRHVGTTEQIDLIFDDATTEKIKAFAISNQITVNTIIQATWALLLGKYTGRKDVMFGVTVSGRPTELEAAEQRVGMYINTIPLFSHLSADQSVPEWLRQIQEGHTTARNYQYSSLNQIATWAGFQGDLFDSLLVFENYPMDAIEATEQLLTFESVLVKDQTNLPFNITAELRDQLRVYFEFNTTLLDYKTVKMIHDHFKTVLLAIVADAYQSPQAIYLQSAGEQLQLIETFGQGSKMEHTHQHVLQVLEDCVGKVPHHTAVTFQGIAYTYHELNRAANNFAALLLENGIKQGDHVLCFMDKGILPIVAVLGTFRAGAAYIPVDTAYPDARIRYVIDNTAAKLLVTEAKHADQLGQLPIRVVTAQFDSSVTAAVEVLPLVGEVVAEKPAYIIYTSGSTGNPKGVIITHGSLACRIQDEIALLSLEQPVNTCFVTNYAFDVAMLDIFLPLCTGGSIAVPTQQQMESPEAFFQLLTQAQVNVLQGTPGYLFYLIQGLQPQQAKKLALQVICVGGESLHKQLVQLVKEKLPNVQLNNHYGPTETTIDAIVAKDISIFEKNIIGKPISNTVARILDETGKAVAMGVPGELCIGGPGVAQGYLNNPELTAAKFFADPYAPFGTLYRTGDLARWLPDGDIEYLGRLDFQVKIRGYRVEIDEVANALLQIPGISEAAVITKQDTAGLQRLVAFVSGAQMPDVEMIKTGLASVLPAYMVPDTIVATTAIPLTSNGKVDRKALADSIDLNDSSDTKAPRTLQETRMLELWKSALEKDRLGIDENFFQAGGHSLSAMALVNKMNQTINTSLTVRELFLYPTIEALAQYLDKNTVSLDYIDLGKEAILDASIKSVGKQPTFVKNPGKIFLTGATGFVGSFLLQELLAHTGADIYCLVRAANDKDAFDRIEAGLRSYELWQEAYHGRIIACAGEIEKTGFGLADHRYQSLCMEIEVVYHNASYMSHFATYEMMKASNVNGTINVIKMACTGRDKQLNYTSTMAVFSREQSQLIHEYTPLEAMQHLQLSGYEGSKWVAEKLIQLARERGVQCNIYRLGLVTGDSVKGHYTSGQWFYKLIDSYIRTEAILSKDFDFEVDLVPVDFAAKAMVALSSEEQCCNQNFHISNYEYSVYELVHKYAVASFENYQELSLSQWLQQAKAYMELGNSLHMPSFLEELTSLPDAEMASIETKLVEEWQARETKVNIKTDSSATHAALVRLGLVFPQPNEKLLATYFNYIQNAELKISSDTISG